ncbi:hypothetical protein ABIA35_009580 [Catenulispora sp. MAP12-49]
MGVSRAEPVATDPESFIANDVQIEVFPLQPKCLALPQAEDERENPPEPVSAPRSRFQEDRL